MSAMSVLAMLIWATIKNKALPNCLSDCYYLLGAPFTIVFGFASWAMLYPAIQCWASPLTFVMVVTFSLVGIASDYKGAMYRKAHFVSAIAAGCFSTVFVIKVCPAASCCYLAVAIGLLDKKRWLLWVEFGCLLSVFAAVLRQLLNI